MKFKKLKGFTLIELLVVIAIIGILASVVLVSFPGANKKAKDSRIVSAISQARTIMTYINSNDGNYAAFTTTHADMVVITNEVSANGGVLFAVTNTADSEACVYSVLNAKSDYWYCADSTGKAGYVSGAANNPSGATYCDGTTAVCPAVTG